MKRLFLLGIISCAWLCQMASGEEYAGKKASLWRDNSWVANLYADPKARATNDIVIIKISESSSASNKAGLKTDKKSSTSMGVDALLGVEGELNGKLLPGFDSSKMFGGSTTASNQGTGESTRQTALSTYIAARVVEVMPNGNLIIEAKKEVIVNHEKQIVVLRGVARPRDVSYDNIIESNKVADMQIHFSGKGPVSEQTRRGWLSWILSVIWPF